MEFIKRNINGIDVNFVKTSKFKTTRVEIVFIGELVETTLSARALMPYVLKGATKNYPSRDKINKYLENQYSSSFHVGVNNITDAHIVNFDMNFINNQYVLEGEDLLLENLRFLHEVLYYPLFDNQVFLEEKRLMEEYFEGSIANKTKYAFTELKKIMFTNSNYHLSPLGVYEDVKNLTLEDVKKEYKKMLDSDSYFITVVGDVSVDETLQKISSIFTKKTTKLDHKLVEESVPQVENVKYEEKVLEVNQAKLVMGYRMNVLYQAPNYYAALIYNLLIGGSSESLLFKEVREKLGLCYFISTNYNPYNGSLFIFSGIDSSKYKEVTKEVEYVLNREIIQEELDVTKKVFLNGVISGMDNNQSLMAKMNQSYIFNYEYNIEETISKIKHVSLEDINKIRHLISLDTIYLLKGANHDQD